LVDMPLVLMFCSCVPALGSSVRDRARVRVSKEERPDFIVLRSSRLHHSPKNVNESENHQKKYHSQQIRPHISVAKSLTLGVWSLQSEVQSREAPAHSSGPPNVLSLG